MNVDLIYIHKNLFSMNQYISKRTPIQQSTKHQEPMYGVIDIADDEFTTKLIKYIKMFGIVVIKNVMTPIECDMYTEQTVKNIETISDFKRLDLKKTWTNSTLPQQVRPGLFHELICNTPTMNKVRFDPNIIKIFRSYYSYFKNKYYEDQDLVVSHDGVNIKPGTIPPFGTAHDWAHLDQTDEPDNIYKCIQGQMVLSNTTAGFRASPKSHLLFKEYLTQDSNSFHPGAFFKFKPEQYILMRKKLEDIGGQWQIKIEAEKGDFIIWTSSVVHSAFLQERSERPTLTDKWNGWRHVVYVCYRPRDEFTEEELQKKYESFLQNGVSDHWGLKIFPKGFNRWASKDTISDRLKGFIQNPVSVYDVHGMKPCLTPEQEVMMGKTMIPPSDTKMIN